MTQQAKTLTELEAADSIDLLPGEQILHVTGRHIVLLIQRMVGPLAIILSCITLVIYRSIGGTFISVQNGSGVGMDSFNRLLLLALGLVVGLFALVRWRLSKARGPQWTLVGLGLFILLWMFARTQGVSFFSINRLEARPFDLVNILLVGVVLLSLVYAIYVFFDWSNDELVLTNKR
nr:hypothetical protein [Chloroflexaceae bacterium]